MQGRRKNIPEKPKNMKRAYGKLIAYNKKEIGIILFALVLAAIGAILTIVGPNQISRITDYISQGLATGIDLDAVAHVGFILIAIYVGSAILTFAQHYIMATVTQHISKNLRKDIDGKINKIPLKYFSSHAYGDVLSRVTNDVDTIGQSFSNSISGIVAAVAQLLGCLVMMLATNWVMAMTTVLSTMIGMVLMSVIMGKSQKYFKARQRSLGELNGYIEEMYTGHDMIRVSDAEKNVKNHFEGLNKQVKEANFKSQFLSGLMQPMMGFVGNLGYVAVCVVGAAMAMNGSITFGVITAFMIYVRLFQNPVTQIAQNMTNMQSAAAASERVFEFLGEEEMADESNKTEKLLPADVKGEVEFQHVRFSYPDTPDKLVIKDFSAHVKPGQKVAIVGPTGAGKTTMVNLLMRFFEMNSGEILIDGKPISSLTRQNVHALFSMVLQDTWMFEGSMKENLAFNNPNVTDAQMEEACRACGMHHFIQTLPQGYNTVLSDNTSISAGQKQLLTIARAMIQNCPMLILDEATSSVDTRTELVTQRAMDQLTEKRTSFVIAHRLSTIKNADVILVIRDGDIVEQGSHEELLQKGGFYAQLYNSQFETAA